MTKKNYQRNKQLVISLALLATECGSQECQKIELAQYHYQANPFQQHFPHSCLLTGRYSTLPTDQVSVFHSPDQELGRCCERRP